jgi:hypothetical protein
MLVSSGVCNERSSANCRRIPGRAPPARSRAPPLELAPLLALTALVVVVVVVVVSTTADRRIVIRPPARAAARARVPAPRVGVARARVAPERCIARAAMSSSVLRPAGDVRYHKPQTHPLRPRLRRRRPTRAVVVARVAFKRAHAIHDRSISIRDVTSYPRLSTTDDARSRARTTTVRAMDERDVEVCDA